MTLEERARLSRRAAFKTAAAAGAGALLSGAAPSADPGLLARENQRPGTTDWQLTYTRVEPSTRYRCPWIEGFVSHASIAAGEELRFIVSTNPAAPFTIDLYRMGYYGGAGARYLRTLGPFEGAVQPDPPVGEMRLRECRWEPCAAITIPEDWPSGVYLGKLSLVEGRCQSYVIFIVRDDRPADLVFQCSDNTWQAYNRWPDNFALYDNGETSWALKDGIKVSYDRPYGKYCQVVDAPLSQGSGEFLLWEFPLVYWLEREGYDVTYCSNLDVHTGAADLTRAKGMISVGHDEYWSQEQYDRVKAAIEAGVNIGFFSANTCCWVTPATPGSDGTPNRVLRRAGSFGPLSERDIAYGMGPFEITGPGEEWLIGAQTINPFNGSADWTVTRPDCWIFEGTGMKAGDGIPGLVGWEFHGLPADIPGLEIVAEGDAINAGGDSAHWTATLYPGPKDNWVFNASTIYWAQGLSSPPGHVLPYAHYGRPHGPDARAQRITKNILDRFIGKT
ncbi:MAG: hypothetical protein GC168_07130 [Candidatus Hydrogenedens sp.]|nr:hypothetical protein [Candidatus Hydrogenedens sp.]